MNRVLVISCSQRKLPGRAVLTALERYDGPSFRLVRRYLATTGRRLTIYIVSAEFGLITSARPIPCYDQRMTKQRADELRSTIARQARRLFAGFERQRGQIFINLGREYLLAFEPAFAFIPDKFTVRMASGAAGRRLAEMHDWLYGPRANRLENQMRVEGRARLRGVEIKLNAERIFSLVRRALEKDGHGAFAHQAWYVPIDGIRVSPKWIVSQLTGLPVSSFHSDEARRVLTQLGVKVLRI
ncbi:MAG: hypothetical protein IRZ19_13170 [Pyrinomonas methylaliphatogenes]|nr:hypothetical protein [Pyrinomonas methylaliphatogenes]